MAVCYLPRSALRAQLRRGVWHILVQCHGMALDDATWKPLQNFEEVYPDVQLEDELFAEAGRNVMIGVTY